ncbi:hypothetical protein V5O48_017741 [Marasmius crinis-equi]|uniref:Ser-Thr-rich glycosyl-phosphatidyl-inositol-anchored membrane family-domain-containing protein n=1 Tax=Marasmius crinis-equi TaxID=585013 RepID=A0ABR3EM65_9AGAR
MFAKLSLLLSLTTLATALTLQTPSNVNSEQNVTVSWSDSNGAPPFTLELHNTIFNSDFAVANSVNPTENSITFLMPQVPAEGGYTFRAVSISDINQVFSETSQFSIGNSTTSGGSSTSATGSGTATATGASGSGTSSGVSTSGSSSGSASGTNSAASSTSSAAGGNGAISLGVSSGVAAVVAGVVGVAAML